MELYHSIERYFKNFIITEKKKTKKKKTQVLVTVFTFLFLFLLHIHILSKRTKNKFQQGLKICANF